ncbi:MAG: Crp/Fnr family transcriptional regulator [Phycisphaerales bacterium]|nr:MAG: Crp/Fnr family transcriptional regulator [Phycisphaerales bacterium]
MPPTPGQIVRECRLFSGLTAEQLDRIAAMAQIRTFDRRRLIFQQDDPCPGLFIVGEGLVKVYNLAAGGKEHVLHLVEPGGTFAEVAAIGGFDCPASAEAMEPTICALLPLEPFKRVLAEDHGLCLGLLTGMAKWVRHFVGLMEDIVLRDALGRVAHYLLDTSGGRSDQIALPAMKKDLASHLNLTSETLSRTLRRLTESDLIDLLDGRHIRIKDAEGLRSVADGMFPES